MKNFFLSLLLCTLSIPATAQQSAILLGDWDGSITVQGTALPITTHFMGDDSLRGTIDIQGATLPLQKISLNEQDSVFFEFATALNVAKFKGELRSDSIINGQYHQAGQQFPFALKRMKQQAKKPDPSVMAAKNYNHKEMVIKNDSIDIGGTLTWPKHEEATQLVIIISGSGAQDRDGTIKPITDFQPYSILADSLTANGIATFRYDDRGVGQSTGNFSNATLDILASDVNAIIAEFTDDEGPEFGKIILLGHSQGGIVGGKVAAKNTKVDKLILMASPSIRLDKILHYQLKESFLRSGFNEAEVSDALSAFGNVLKAIHEQKEIKTARKSYKEQFIGMFRSLPEQAKANITSLDSTASAQGNTLLEQFTTPQMQSLMFYELTNDLQGLTVPVLVLFGGKDTQVTVEMNKEPIKKALESGNAKHQTEIFTAANHLFQKAKTGQVQEYGSLGNKFIDGFTSTIADWIKKSTSK
jgi:hypothetical protein